MWKRGPLVATMLVTATFWGGCMLLPGEQRKIARRLDQLAEAASVNARENPVIRMANAARVSRYFTEDIRIDTDRDSRPIQGRDAVAILVAQAQAAVEDLRVRFTDVAITVSAPENATAHLTLVVFGRQRGHVGPETPESHTGGAADPGPSLDARELLLTLRKVDGDWLIAHVEVIKTLEPPQ